MVLINRGKFANKGFSLPEFMVAVGILAFVIVGLFRIFIYCAVLSNLSRNMTIALSEAETKLEEMRNHPFNSIVTDYSSGGTPGNTFSTTQLDGMGVIYIDSSNPELLVVEIMVSWKNDNNRIVGEDIDLDGEIDSGEDIDNDSKLDSLVTIASMISKR